MKQYAPPDSQAQYSEDRPPNSLGLGRWFGIGVFAEVHLAFPLLMIISQSGSGKSGLFYGCLVFLILFGSVLLHEFGHALAGRSCGVGTRYITLGMLGGVAYLEGKIRNWKDDVFITLAGPSVNVLLWVVAMAIQDHLPKYPMTATQDTVELAVHLLGVINLNLLWFNMIPAWPMDGGRLLRALLEPSCGPQKALRITCRVAMVAAICMGLWAVKDFLDGKQAIFKALIAYMVFSRAKGTLASLS
jgi:Zn-dependent protease